MSSIDSQLPGEIVQLICEELAYISPRSLINFCLSSKIVHGIGRRYILRHANITSSSNNLESSLLQFISRVKGHEAEIRSIDLRFTKGQLSSFLMQHPAAFAGINRLSVLLPAFSKLRTFIINPPDGSRRNSILPTRAILELLKNLPQSVENLEIDIGALEMPPRGQQYGHDEQNTTCACGTVASLFNQLRHLRIRKSFICNKLFPAAEPSTQRSPLKTLTLRLDLDKAEWNEFPGHAMSCLSVLRTNPARIAEALKARLLVGTFPQLQRALIVGRFGSTDSLCTSKGVIHSGFVVYDVLKRLTTELPCLAVESAGETEQHRWRGSKWGDLFMIRDLEGEERLASYGQLLLALEGETTFRSLASESHVQPFTLGQLPSKHNSVLPTNVHMPLWKREEEASQCLLRGQHHEGFPSPSNGIREILPNGYFYDGTDKYGGKIMKRISSG